MAGSVHVPWYATGFRGDALEAALGEIAPLALRYGATSYHVFRMRDDRYKFLQVATFPDKAAWERYWAGPEFTRWRAVNSSYYQVPVVYGWADNVVEGSLPYDPVSGGAPASAHSGSRDTGDAI
jgi:quinol monooxygenase YgiN